MLDFFLMFVKFSFFLWSEKDKQNIAGMYRICYPLLIIRLKLPRSVRLTCDCLRDLCHVCLYVALGKLKIPLHSQGLGFYQYCTAVFVFFFSTIILNMWINPGKFSYNLHPQYSMMDLKVFFWFAYVNNVCVLCTEYLLSMNNR